MTLTDEQRTAVIELRAVLNDPQPPAATSQSLDERARLPAPGGIPTDVTVEVEIAPPSPSPHPLFNSNILKVPERVPIFFYALRNNQADPADTETRVIFWIHGGGNVTGHPTHDPFIQFYAQLLRAVASCSGNTNKCVLVAPCYRLATAPQNVFPAALQDLVAAYDYVLGKGYKPSNIVIAGDSAGGNHAIVLTHLVLQSKRVSPHGVIAIAPGAIQEYDHLSDLAKANASVDILDTLTCERMSKLYVGDTGVARTDPLVSGAFIPFEASWPKTLILVGSGDILIDAAREVSKRLATAGAPVELIEYDEHPHGWWVFPHIFLENIQDAVQRIAHFIF